MSNAGVPGAPGLPGTTGVAGHGLPLNGDPTGMEWDYLPSTGELQNTPVLVAPSAYPFGYRRLNISGGATEPQAAAQAAKQFPNGKKPQQLDLLHSASGLAKDAAQAVGKSIVEAIPGGSQDLKGINAVGGFFNGLTEAGTWIRVAKVVIGATLIIVGLARLTGADKAIARGTGTLATATVK
jgi:hypothetical protein